MQRTGLRNAIWLLLGLCLAVVVHLLLTSLPPQQRLMAAIFSATIVYWLAEPIPLYVTGLLAALAAAVLLGPLGPRFGAPPLDYRDFLYPFASPVVVLMFGGFVMARVFSKHNLDIEFCRMILLRVGSRPRAVLLAMMTITAAMSMWMSNTATTAIMVATVLPIARKLPANSNMVRALMLGIPFAANVGGMATPIGTPPNAIAIGLLADAGVSISFFSWMLAGLPLMILLLALVFLLLQLFFPIRRTSFVIDFGAPPAIANRGLVYTVFFATVALWVTDQLHHVPAALIALVPVVVFAISGLLEKQLLRELAWDILLLIGGGLALGVGIQQTGLADTIVATLLPGAGAGVGSMALLCVLIAALATFMSNTAAANLILPLAVTVAGAFPQQLAVPVALCASLGMALPISTPPNAIAYGSELIAERDMLRVGVVVTLVGVALTIAYERLLFALLPGAGAG
ncbi:MAG: DASS family sodium-coupled anion symporter [Candidatus Eisenbacteria bacterium]|nr:DASS family sodium-coupled anion symporter [Candidatus Eisenbacteria bacterium]